MATGRPSDLELQVLSVLWRSGPSTVRQVLEKMPDKKKRSYTTILTVLQLMEGKKLVTHTNEGRAHVYEPAVSRKQVLGPLLRNMVTRVFGGSATEAFQHLLSETDVSDDELGQIRELIDKTDKTRKSRTGRKRNSRKGGVA